MGRDWERMRRGDSSRSDPHREAAPPTPEVEPHSPNRAAEDYAFRTILKHDAGIDIGESGRGLQRDAAWIDRSRLQLVIRQRAYTTCMREAVVKFEAIVRRRKAEPMIARRISSEAIAAASRAQVLKQMGKFGEDLAKQAGYLAGQIAGAVSRVDLVKGIVDGEIEGKKEEAEVNAIETIVAGVFLLARDLDEESDKQIVKANAAHLAEWIESMSPSPNQEALITQLDELLDREMAPFRSAQEQIDALTSHRRSRESDIRQAERRFDRHGNAWKRIR